MFPSQDIYLVLIDKTNTYCMCINKTNYQVYIIYSCTCTSTIDLIYDCVLIETQNQLKSKNIITI